MSNPDPIKQAQWEVAILCERHLTRIFERLETQGLIAGNGLHMAQKVSKYACELIDQRKFKEAIADD